MKRFLLTLILAITTFVGAMAITVSGTIISTNTSLPVANHLVYLNVFDSLNGTTGIYDTTVTNNNGWYSFNFTNSNPSYSYFIVSVFDCQNNQQNYNANYSTTTANFNICTSTVTNPCQASFFSVPDSSNQYSIHFINTSTGNPTSYQWSFGDNTTSTLQNPTHTYNSLGYYFVTLTISGSGCQSTIYDTVVISGTTTCQASFQATTSMLNPMQVNFANYSTPNLNSFTWNFGDGTTSNQYSPTHIYTAAGTYTVILVATGSGCTSTFTSTITVSNSTTSCQASFFPIQDSMNTLKYYFIDQSIGNPTSWSWNFGDGSTSTQQYPTHTYSQNGVYVVTLTIFGANCQSTTWDTLFVGGGLPLFNISGLVTVGSYPLDNGEAMLFDLNLGTVTVVPIDSMGFYYFSNIQPSVYVLGASAGFNSIYFNNYFPTYYGNSATWTGATIITLSSNLFNANIDLIPIIPSNGGGAISGTVTTNLIKAGVPNVPVNLFTTSGNPVRTTKTDATGTFNFNNLTLDSYLVLAEVPGMPSDTMTIVLNSTLPTSTTNYFTITGTSIVASGVGMDEIQSISLDKVYPVPFNNEISIDVYVIEKSEIKMEIVNAYGQVVKSYNETLSTGNHALKYNVTDLSAGTYVLRSTNQNGESNYKMIIKL